MVFSVLLKEEEISNTISLQRENMRVGSEITKFYLAVTEGTRREEKS